VNLAGGSQTNRCAQSSCAAASVSKLEPYKTHLAYVKERRTDEEAAALLEEALTQLRARRGQVAPQE